MTIKQLRNHIPIGGPARREPVDGSETDMRVSLGLEPAWFHDRLGVDLGESWHKDPYARHAALEKMKDELVRAFPEVPYWRAEDERDLATISGVYGAYPVPHLFGIPLRYYPNMWPELDPDRRLSVEEIEALDARTVLSSSVMDELFHQMDVIEREWGPIHGYLNWQGVLNNAFNIRGPEIFIDMYERPEFVHRFFDLIADVMIGLATVVQERQRASGFAIDQFSVANCVVNMISPTDYATFVAPRDARIAGHFDRFGVHTCNWDITPYLGPLSELPKLGYIDMGMVSDLERVRETFPDARRAVIYSPWKLHQASIEDIRSDMETIYDRLAPCDLVMADIQADTPDSRVRELLSICGELEERGTAGSGRGGRGR
mgnify:CR=1 FL=1